MDSGPRTEDLLNGARLRVLGQEPDNRKPAGNWRTPGIRTSNIQAVYAHARTGACGKLAKRQRILNSITPQSGQPAGRESGLPCVPIHPLPWRKPTALLAGH